MLKRLLSLQKEFVLLLVISVISVFFVAGCSSTVDPETATPDAGVVEPTEDSESVAAADLATLPPPVILEATHTPVPVTNTPEATQTPVPTAVPPTNTPEPVPPTSTPAPVQPTNPPPPPASPTAPPPTEPPPPTAEPVGANGLVASHFALQDRSNYSAGGKIWFEFTISNSTGNEVNYNAVGVMPRKNGVDIPQWFQRSYGGNSSTISPGGFSWEDNIKIPEPGSYTLRMAVCFDGLAACDAGTGTFHTLSQEIPVTIN